MLYIFKTESGKGVRADAVVSVEPVEGEDNVAEFYIYEDKEGDLLQSLESETYFILEAEGLSEDGKFDKYRLDHWAALPKIFRNAYYWVEEYTDEEADKLAVELGYKEDDPGKSQ